MNSQTMSSRTTTTESETKTAGIGAIPLQPFGSLDDVSRALQGQMSAAAAIPRAVLEAQLTMGAELFGFLGRRLKAQAELCHDLSLCRELSDAVQAQRRFNEKVASDYSEEVDQMTTMLSREVGVVAAAASGAVETASKGVKIAA